MSEMIETEQDARGRALARYLLGIAVGFLYAQGETVDALHEETARAIEGARLAERAGNRP